MAGLWRRLTGWLTHRPDAGGGVGHHVPRTHEEMASHWDDETVRGAQPMERFRDVPGEDVSPGPPREEPD